MKPEGILICSEIVWLKDVPNREIFDFWNADYPEIDTVEAKLQQITEAGYTTLGHFILPHQDWEDYYPSIIMKP